MSQLDSVQVSPYVASAIIEHAKRRLNAAGYLLGTRTNEEIIVVDYVPMTHSGNYHDVTSKAYADERLRRIENKRAYFKHQLIGWYSAGSASEGVTEEQFREWCELPASTFAGKPARKALYIHCAMPGTQDAELAIRWSAFITLNRLEDDPNKGGKSLITCQRRTPLQVLIAAPAEDAASNVMLNHVVAQTLYNGSGIAERNPLLNLDEVAFRASTEGKPVADALTEVQKHLHQTIVKAKEIHASAASRPEDRRMAMTVLDSVQQLRKMKHELEQQQQNPSAREDFITQRFKDALMIKAVTILLRRQLAQIESLAGQYHRTHYVNTLQKKQSKRDRRSYIKLQLA